MFGQWCDESFDLVEVVVFGVVFDYVVLWFVGFDGGLQVGEGCWWYIGMVDDIVVGVDQFFVGEVVDGDE